MYDLKGGECVRGGKLFGWTGCKCASCGGHGEVEDAKRCIGCAGTGDEWGLMPNQPADLPPDSE